MLKLGIVQNGTFASRPHDAFMLGVADTAYGRSLGRFLAEKRALQGGTGAPSRHEYTIEIGYRAELMPGVMLTPDIQYEIDPGTRGFPTAGREIGDPLVLGLKLTMDLGRVGGFARAPR
jgi:porin